MADQDAGPSLNFHPNAKRVVRFGAFRMDLSDGTLWRNGDEVPLPPRALLILQYLLERAGRIVPKQALMDAAWKDSHVGETSLTEAIGLIRQALGDDPQKPQYVQTVPRRGYRFIAAITVEGAGAPVAPVLVRPAETTSRIPRGAVRWSLGIVAILIVVGATLAWLQPWRGTNVEVTRATITLPPHQAPAPSLTAHPVMTLSPDGKHIVYVAGASGSYQLYLRRRDQFEATPIPATRNGHGPFFAPDGRWIGFFADGKLKKITLDGGEPVALAAAPGGFGGTWMEDGSIVFAPTARGGLARYTPADNGVTQLTRPCDTCGYRWPHAAGADTVIATRWRSSSRDAAVVAISLGSGQETVIADQATFGRFVPPSHVVFLRDGNLFATTFPGKGNRAEHVLSDVLIGNNGSGQFAFSAEGTLVYLPGSPERTARLLGRVASGDRIVDLPQPGRAYQNLAVCGDRLAVSINERGTSDIFVGGIDRAALTQLTTNGSSVEPVWMPGCRTLAFASNVSAQFSIYAQPADGTAPARRLLESPRSQAPGSWSADGERFAYVQLEPETGADIWLLESKTGAARPVVATAANEAAPRLSPDGKWLAYESHESGRSQVYVISLETSARQQVSPERGSAPAWTPDGKALLYLTGGAIERVTFEVRENEAVIGTPVRVLSHPDVVVFRPLDDGIVVARRTAEHLPLTRLNLVLNWFAELRRAAAF